MRAFQRGFFCADLSLRYPYRECTITIPMLLIYTLLLPMLFICVVEIMRICKCFRLRKYVTNLARSLATFSFGFIATYLTTELAKNVVGRLRPHFYTACQPRLADGTSCESAYQQLVGGGVYVEHYYCSNRNLSARQLRELHVSFPSAHSSLSFYAMLLLCFYLHAVWRGRGTTRVLRHILQFLLLLVACYIALSRVRDYWHHWSDVLAGALLGLVYAVLTAVYVGRMLRPTFTEAAAQKHKKHAQHQYKVTKHHQHHHHQLTSSQHHLTPHDARSRMLLVAASGSVSNLQQQQLLSTTHEEHEKQQLHEQVAKEHLMERGGIGGGGGGDCEWKLQAVVLPT
ncbi:putative phosphatidate phosphatase [Anastrepha ludens]|uniref:putative phosphatidate phosphatase n=1 Tax=Anastrepha ludens TaxID=28586 RepID=UPI0023B04F85|nr:putative phosphatidate phosphatase [Anastrepha ludens]XP_053954199.1 putative phosphatidate phosphatase [Anastrepha ludens]XP_053954200.1 putative phosphatidate phosphatase [Anastrepha ludens]XP_053954201.1 putative phosphatidate phosphatase [Anastrepha ludens]XP_053954202.1 putative phosphatidate phosphatase [Anastrepha ludens]XP_053954203.1 putative phosphatidate phosphatase [Anastrepha ludens]XP_053954204.1 putative phosphatidate phosphatase [Anastrepha ludens]XP_053954205.1 putative p